MCIRDIFVPAVKKFSKENDLQPRALLALDNATAHPPEEELINGDIKAIFLPPNITPLLQPMYQQVLQNMKCVYKKLLLRSLIENEDPTQTILQVLNKVTIRGIIYWIAEGWENVKQQLIRQSWSKLWPRRTYIDSPEQADERSEVLQLIQQIPGCEEAEVNEWLAADIEDHLVLTDEDVYKRQTHSTINTHTHIP